jgi:hypothetical protein
MQVSYAAEPPARATRDVDTAVDPGTGPLRHQVRANLVVAGFSLGLSVAVAVGLALLMTLLG